MPCSFQYTSSEASDELTTSTACTLAEYSWPMRCSSRSAPLRSTLHCTPGNFASNAFPIVSDSLRSIEVYQTTLPSLFAASISAGVMALAGGAADINLVENAVPAASALEPISTSRREIFEPFIDVSSIALFCRLAPTFIRSARGSAPAEVLAKLHCLAEYFRPPQ